MNQEAKFLQCYTHCSKNWAHSPIITKRGLASFSENSQQWSDESPFYVYTKRGFLCQKIGNCPQLLQKGAWPLFLGNCFFFLYNRDSNIHQGIILESIP